MKKKDLLAKGAAILAIYLIVLLATELFIRVFSPQPLDAFAFPKNPQPGSTYKAWGLDVRYNSYGMRDRAYKMQRTPGVERIAVIGDSITFGVGVPLGATYHKKLEAYLNEAGQGRFEVPTFNMPDSDLEWQSKTYEDVVRKFHPDIVIDGFCLNDFLDYEETYQRVGGIEARQTVRRRVWALLSEIHRWARLKSHLYFLVFERSRRLFWKYAADIRGKRPESFAPMQPQLPAFDKTFSSTMAKIKKYHDLVAGDGVRFIVVIFPYEMQMSSEHVRVYERELRLYGFENAPQGLIQARFVKALKKEGFETVDLLPAFQRSVQRAPQVPLFFRNIGGMLDWVHPNNLGHDIAAREIAAYLLRSLKTRAARSGNR